MRIGKKIIKPLAIGVALVLAVAASWLFFGSSDEAGSPAIKAAAPTASNGAGAMTKPALTVVITRPSPAEWRLTLPANGSVSAWQETIVGAEIGGLRLTEVLVNVGDSVRRGQVLARLSSDTVQVELAQNKASLAEAQATLAEAQANAERARKLQASGAFSAQQINQYLTMEQTARARVDAQRARLQAEELKLRQTRVLAPDDGVISTRTATVGAVVQAGQELFKLIRGGRLEWRAEVTAADLSRLSPGMNATLTTADGSTVTGRVRMVAPTIDPQTRNGIVYVDLPKGSAARAGMFARGEFELGRSEALTLPQSAVLLRDGFSYTYRLGDDSRVLQTKITTGRRVGDRIEVLGGLDPNAKVVATGGSFLGDGDLVRVVEGNTAPLRSADTAGETKPSAAR